MVYTHERLEEAISVINAEKARVRDEKAEQYARTHYRDDFAFRGTAKDKSFFNTEMKYAEKSAANDNDDEYNPETKRSSRRPKPKVQGEKGQKRSRTPRQKYEKGIIEPMISGAASCFVTLSINLSQQQKDALYASLEMDRSKEWYHRSAYKGYSDNDPTLSATNDVSLWIPKQQTDWQDSAASYSYGSPWDPNALSMPKGGLRSGKVRETFDQRKKNRDRCGLGTDEIDEEGEEGGHEEQGVGPSKKRKLTDTSSAGSSQDQSKSLKSGSDKLTGTLKTTLKRRTDKRRRVFRPLAVQLDSSDSSAQNATALANDSDIEMLDGDGNENENGNDDRKIKSSISASAKSKDEVGELYKISTAFAHPLLFKRPVQDCSFCRDYRFGIIGYGRKEVTVSPNPANPLQYHELGDGHGLHHSPTSMCTACVTERLDIIKCDNHRLVRLKDVEVPIHPKALAAYAQELKDGLTLLPVVRPTHIRYICSVCPRPARYQCRASRSQSHAQQNGAYSILNLDKGSAVAPELNALGFSNGRNGDQASSSAARPASGCSFKVCEFCFKEIDKNGGRMDENVTSARTQSVTGTRADVAMLSKKHALWKTFNHEQ